MSGYNESMSGPVEIFGAPLYFYSNHHVYLGLGLVLVLAATLSFVFRKEWKTLKTAPPSKASPNEKKQERKYGEWLPVTFQYPPVNASPQEPAKLKPIPYRPFRHGQYHITMGIRSMPWDEWIELDNEFEKCHRIKDHRIRTRGDRVIRVLPEKPGVVGSGADAAIETVHELSEYLALRFPKTFSTTRHPINEDTSGWYGLTPIKSIRIEPLGVTYNLPLNTQDGKDAAVRALEIAALLIQDDLALMVEGEDGRYYFQAGAICVAGFWRIQDKIGLPLDEIHNTGNVPHYKEKLQLSMERFFQRLAVDKPVTRNNYFFQVIKNQTPESIEEIDPSELAWAISSHGPEDDFHGSHPAEQPMRPTATPANIRLRSERQTLRRLPRSGAILFGIRTYITPIEKLAQEPGVAKRLASSMRAWSDEVGEYKGKNSGGWWDVTMNYLDKKADEESGTNEDLKIKDNYPF
ncbi:hypothetical protein C0995_007004 [Termitomyces sp. Mi166|nr:hypothetical protein C0995_007004 [Termitomyces sp. Mi166\